MKEQLYRIHWKSTITPLEGHGVSAFPEKVASKICEEMNTMDSPFHVIHWIEPIPAEKVQHETPR